MANRSGIEIKPSHKGKLHRALGVPEGQKIPAAKLQQAKHSKSAAVRKEANFASNAKGFSHGKTSEGRELERRLAARDKR